MGAIRSHLLQEKFEKITNNEHNNLMLHIHKYILNKDSNIEDYVFDNGNNYIAYKHISIENRNIMALEYKKKLNKVEVAVYWHEDSKEINKTLDILGLDRNKKEHGIGALRFRPYISSVEDFKKIEILVQEGIEKFYLAKGLER